MEIRFKIDLDAKNVQNYTFGGDENVVGKLMV
jgi:hypothetical protein